MKKHDKQKLFWLGTILIIIAALLYCSWPLGFWLNPAASRTGLASELGAIGQPYNWLFIWGDISSGILLIIGCWLLLKLVRSTRWVTFCLVMLAVYGICGALDAALPEKCVPSLQVCGPIFHDPQLVLHGAFDILGSIALFMTLIATWLDVRRNNRAWLPWMYWIGIGGVIFALLSLGFFIWGGPSYWAQRYYLTLSTVWVAALPFVLRKNRHDAKVITT